MHSSWDIRIGIVVASVLALMVAAVPAAGASQGASPSVRRYVGTTSQGFDMEFELTGGSHGHITSFQFDYRLTCAIDGTTQRVGVGYGARIALHDGQFAFAEVSPDSSIEFSGSISRSAAAGLTRWAFPAFTAHEIPQTCATQVLGGRPCQPPLERR